MTDYTATILLHELQTVRDRVAKINKKAAKVGAPAIVLTEGEVVVRVSIGPNARRVRYEELQVTLTMSEPVRINGYRLIARLENVDGETVVRAVPGEDVPHQYRDRATTCDHCNTKRFRKDYFLVQDGAGTYLRVGSSCLKDFLGHDASRALWLNTLTGWADPDGDRWPISETLFCKHTVLAMTAAVIRERGWVSRKQSNESWETDKPRNATADDVFAQLDPYRARKLPRIKILERDRRDAQAALRWYRDTIVDKNGKSDYEHNLHIVAKAETLRSKHFGILCSLVPVAMRALGQRQERAAQVRSHIGTVGQRRKFCGKVMGWSSFASDFGSTHYFRVATDEGMVVVKSSKVWWDENLTNGSDVAFTATIKQHKDYKGRPETQVNRAVQS